jgi:hypothetical protein
VLIEPINPRIRGNYATKNGVLGNMWGCSTEFLGFLRPKIQLTKWNSYTTLAYLGSPRGLLSFCQKRFEGIDQDRELRQSGTGCGP